MTAELAHLEQQTSQPDFWNQAQRAAKISRKKSSIERDLQQWRDIDGKRNDLDALLELAEESGARGDGDIGSHPLLAIWSCDVI